MQHEQRNHQREDCDAVAGNAQEIFVGFDNDRNVAPGSLNHQRPEHDQERHRQ